MARQVTAARLAIVPRTMNKTEGAFAAILTAQFASGEVAAFRFEAITFRIGQDCRYTPDFYVLMRDGSVTLYEVKGFWRDDARVKIKAAAAAYPEFRFVAVQRVRGQWLYEDIRP